LNNGSAFGVFRVFDTFLLVNQLSTSWARLGDHLKPKFSGREIIELFIN